MRKSLDVRRLGAAASYPGIDPRMWIATATVMEIGFDSNEGIFADVQLQPEGDILTALIASPYAGNGFGFHCPIEKDDTVLIAIPGGDPDAGAWVIARAWNAADKPPADAGDGDDIVEDVIFKTKSGKKFVLIAQDAEIIFHDGSQAYVRGNDLQTALDNFAQAIISAAAALAPSPPSTPLTGANGATFVAGLTTAAQALSQAAQTYLSTKIKGE